MGYTRKDWLHRISQRSDISSSLVHLTRESEEIKNPYDVLVKILVEKKLAGSSTTSGFICGPRRAVCFQDAPLHSICQNTFFEQKKRESDPAQKIRYRPIGLAFSKDYLFKKGARPVIYEKTDIAKGFLPEAECWRIVRLDLSDENAFIDWTHEREWRVPDDLSFELEEVTIIAVNNNSINALAKSFKEATGNDVRDEVKGIVTLTDILY